MTAPRWRIQVGDDLAVLRDAGGLVGHAFQTHVWLDAWSGTLGRGGRPLMIVVADPHPVLLLAMTLVRRGGLRIVEPLGGDVTDYHAPLADPAFAATLTPGDAARLWHDICRALPPHDLILWPRMPALLDAGLPNPLAGLAVARPAGTAWSLALPTGADAPRLRPRFAKRLAQARRQLDRRGAVALEVIDTPAARRAAVDEVIAMKGRRWRETGARDASHDDRFRAFYQHIAESDDPQLRPHLSRLRCGAETVAMHLGVVHRGRFHFLLVGWQGGEWRKYSPGLLMTDALVRHAMARELAVFDFTVGEEAYKLEWADTALPLLTLEQARTWRGHLAFAARRAERIARRRLKRVAWLSHAVRWAAGRPPLATGEGRA